MRLSLVAWLAVSVPVSLAAGRLLHRARVRQFGPDPDEDVAPSR